MLDARRHTLGELAEWLRLPRDTLAAYIGGKRRTPAPVARRLAAARGGSRRLAAVLRQHAAELAALAAELDDVT